MGNLPVLQPYVFMLLILVLRIEFCELEDVFIQKWMLQIHASKKLEPFLLGSSLLLSLSRYE